MRKVFFVLFVLSLVAVGFFMGTMSADNKAYALLLPGPGESGVECMSAVTGEPCPMGNPTVTIEQAEYDGLLKELETYKALEMFWAEQALGMPAPVMAESPVPPDPDPGYPGGKVQIM